ncbi:peptidase MA family metallohydrolase [Candidatus Chlorohelix sp.]|uniref:peptidase MA family metallohydrolase n=1 Tax=Candidatus Chlorohelix sp. TaxID=3139201 RepID=UPI00305770F7
MNPLYLRKSYSFVFLIIILLLYNVLILFTTTQAHAQANAAVVEFTDTSALARYKVGVKFNLKAQISNALSNKLELKVRFGKQGAENTYPVDIQAGAQVNADYTVLHNNNNMPTGVPLLYSWDLTLNNGAHAISNQSLIIYQDNKVWNQLEGKNVTMRWYSGDNSYGNLMYNVAADSLATYEKRFNMAISDHIYVSIFASDRDFFDTVDGRIPAWAGGVAYPETGEVLLIAALDNNASQYIGYGIPHEMAHMALYQFVHKSVPHWLDEGFAVYNQNSQNPNYLKIVKDAVQNNTLLGFDSITQGFPVDAKLAELAYAQSVSLITFLINKLGDAAFCNLLDQLRTKTFKDAFNATYGVPFSEVEQQWRNNISGKTITLITPLLTGKVSAFPSTDNANSITVSGLRWEMFFGGGMLTLAILFFLIFYVTRRARRIVARQRALQSVPVNNSYNIAPQPNYHNGQNPLVTPPALPEYYSDDYLSHR